MLGLPPPVFQAIKAVLLKSTLVGPLPSNAPGLSSFPSLIFVRLVRSMKLTSVSFGVSAASPAGIVCRLVGNFNFVNLVAPQKTLLPKEAFSPVTFVSLKLMVTSPVPAKAFCSILVIELDSMLLVSPCVKVLRAVVPLKALSLILVTVGGNLTVARLAAFRKVLPSIVVI